MAIYEIVNSAGMTIGTYHGRPDHPMDALDAFTDRMARRSYESCCRALGLDPDKCWTTDERVFASGDYLLLVRRVVKYQIETRHSGHGTDWRADVIGDNNEFDTEQEALDAIPGLAALGAEWAEAEYRVQPI